MERLREHLGDDDLDDVHDSKTRRRRRRNLEQQRRRDAFEREQRDYHDQCANQPSIPNTADGERDFHKLDQQPAEWCGNVWPASTGWGVALAKYSCSQQFNDIHVCTSAECVCSCIQQLHCNWKFDHGGGSTFGFYNTGRRTAVHHDTRCTHFRLPIPRRLIRQLDHRLQHDSQLICDWIRCTFRILLLARAVHGAIFSYLSDFFGPPSLLLRAADIVERLSAAA